MWWPEEVGTWADQGVKGSPLGGVGAALHGAPGFLFSFADTEIELSQLSPSQNENMLIYSRSYAGFQSWGLLSAGNNPS